MTSSPLRRVRIVRVAIAERDGLRACPIGLSRSRGTIKDQVGWQLLRHGHAASLHLQCICQDARRALFRAFGCGRSDLGQIEKNATLKRLAYVRPSHVQAHFIVQRSDGDLYRRLSFGTRGRNVIVQHEAANPVGLTLVAVVLIFASCRPVIWIRALAEKTILAKARDHVPQLPLRFLGLRDDGPHDIQIGLWFVHQRRQACEQLLPLPVIKQLIEGLIWKPRPRSPRSARCLRPTRLSVAFLVRCSPFQRRLPNHSLNSASRIYSPCPAAPSATGIALRMNAPNIGTVNAVSP